VSRLRRIADRDRIFFLTTNLAPSAAPFSAIERDVVCLEIDRQHAKGDFALFAWVVMPTHLHLLMAPDRIGLAAAMQQLKRSTALRIAAARRVSAPIWQPRYFDFVLRRAGDFWDKLEYIRQNPVVAGLVRKAADWKWSSACRSGDGPKTDPIDFPVDRNAWLHRGPRS
jgi:putative transposase